MWPSTEPEVTTRRLLTLLFTCETSPWADWWAEKERTVEFGVATVELVPGRAAAMKLARQLRPFGVRPHDVGDRQSRRKGYRRDDFEDAFARYLASEVAHAAHAQYSSQKPDFSRSRTDEACATSESAVSRMDTGRARGARPETENTAPDGNGGLCTHPVLWLARDGIRRCVDCDPPAFPGEVVAEAAAP